MLKRQVSKRQLDTQIGRLLWYVRNEDIDIWFNFDPSS